MDSQRHLSFLICFPMEKEISSGSIHKVLWVSLALKSGKSSMWDHFLFVSMIKHQEQHFLRMY